MEVLSGALVGLVLAGPASAPARRDVYFEQTVVTSADGRPAGPGVVSQVWYSGRKMRLEVGAAVGGPAFILRLDTGKAYRVDPGAKTVTAMDAERLRARSHMDLSMAGDLMGGDEEGSVRTAALRTPRTIAGHACRGYRITSGSAVLDVYVTEALPIGIEAFTEFLEWSGASESLAGIVAELRKLRGFPLETRSRITVLGKVQETRSTVTKVTLGPQPASLFEPPQGFRVVAEAPEEQE